MGLKKAKVLKITPIQAIKATGTWTFTNALTTGCTLIIGSETYQANADGAGVSAGNIAFATGLGATASTSVIDALVARINASGALVTATTGSSGRVLTVESLIGGIGGNLHCTGSLTGTWTTTSLAGGVDGTAGSVVVDSSYIYFKKSDHNWYVVTGTLL
jgi:hypothetical protein